MSVPANNIILPIISKILENNSVPLDIEQLGSYVEDKMKLCENEARKIYPSITPNQLGRCNGDWFEYLFKSMIESQLKKENVTVFPGRGRKINEIKGFHNVDWIPMPDAVVRNINDFRAVITLKWGMRHDRMYEAAYEAYAIKDWIKRKKLPSVKVFLFTNDNFSGFESRLKIMSKVPVLDGVFYLRYDKLPLNLQGVVKSFSELVKEIKSICI